MASTRICHDLDTGIDHGSATLIPLTLTLTKSVVWESITTGIDQGSATPLTSSPHQTSQPTDIVPGGNGEPPTSLSRSALVGLVVGAICGTVVVTLAVVFAIRKYYRRRRTKREETLRENASSEVPQPNHMKDSGPYESGGAEILEAGGSGLAELPNQGAPLYWYELPAGMEDSIDPQFPRIRDEDSQQPAAEKPQQHNLGGGVRV